MNIRTIVNYFNLVYKQSDATGSFPDRVPTAVMPNYDGLIPSSPNPNFGQTADNTLHLVFFGQGATGTFDAQIIYWNKLPGLFTQTQLRGVPSIAPADIWIPEIVYNISGTLGSVTGVAGSFIDNTHLFADTLAVTSDTVNVSAAEILSPSGGIASLTLDMSGPQIIEVAFNCDSATAMNAIYKTY